MGKHLKTGLTKAAEARGRFTRTKDKGSVEGSFSCDTEFMKLIKESPSASGKSSLSSIAETEPSPLSSESSFFAGKSSSGSSTNNSGRSSPSMGSSMSKSTEQTHPDS